MSWFSSILKYKYPLTLFFILAWGAFLRLYELPQQSLWIDEGFTLMQEKSIYSHGYPLLMSGHAEFKDALLPYILAFSRIFTGENIFVFRLVSVSFGIASVLVVYLVGKAYFGKNAGIGSAFLISFSYWHIAWSRQARSYSLFVFLFLLSLLFYIYYEKSNHIKWLYFLTMSIILALLAKFSFGIILAASVFMFLIFKKKSIPNRILVLIVAPLILAVWLTREFLLKVVSFSEANYLKYYIVDYFWEYFGIFFVLAIIGGYLTLSDRTRTGKNWPQLNLFIFSSALLFFSFFSIINQRRYLFFLTPFIFIYATHCVLYLTKSKKLLALAIFALIIGADQLTIASLNFKPQQNYFLEKYTPQPNFAAAYRYISENRQKERMISPYPFMDYIYLGQADYALPISYTGLPNESSLKFPTEYYTNSPRLFSPEAVSSASEKDGALAILDDMAISRSDKNVVEFIQRNGQLVFENTNELGQKIKIYRLSQKNP